MSEDLSHLSNGYPNHGYDKDAVALLGKQTPAMSPEIPSSLVGSKISKVASDNEMTLATWMAAICPYIDFDSARFSELMWVKRADLGLNTMTKIVQFSSNADVSVEDIFALLQDKYPVNYQTDYSFRVYKADKTHPHLVGLYLVAGVSSGTPIVIASGDPEQVMEIVDEINARWKEPSVISIRELLEFTPDGPAENEIELIENKVEKLGHDAFYPFLKLYNEKGEEIAFSIAELAREFKESSANSMLFVGPPGCGKAQPLDAGIHTPDGWKTMGDMVVGTDVYTKTGEIAKVTGVFPQGKKEIFRITFYDGRTTECCKEHLWEVYHKDWFSFTNRSKVINTEELMRVLSKQSFLNRCYVPVVTHPKIDDKEFIIHPYILGVLLGDGSLHANKRIEFTNSDEFVYTKFNSLLPDYVENVTKFVSDTRVVHCLKNRKTDDVDVYWKKDNPFFQALFDFGLGDVRSDTKFIPDVYMEASERQKLELLNGLMDTDGYVCSSGSMQYTTTSEKLALQVQHLIRSLGGICSIHVKHPTFSYCGSIKNGKLAYNLNIRIKNPRRLVTLPRKQERIPEKYQYNDSIRLRIEKIEYVGMKEAQCIMVDHPSHLYVTDDFIVTHNTVLLKALMFYMKFKHNGIANGNGTTTHPSFVRWLKSFKNDSLVVIEDAHDLIISRDKGNDQMSNILNHVEGISSRNNKLIISTNLSSTNMVDEALIRPGRNFRILEFRKLVGEEINDARAAIGKEPIEVREDETMSLAEALNYHPQHEIQNASKNTKAFGFVK